MGIRLIAATLAILFPFCICADTTVRSHEGGKRDGKRWGESYTEYHSTAGLRVDVQADGAASPYMSFLFFRNPDRLFLVQGTSVTRIDAAAIRDIEAKAGSGSEPQPLIRALGTRHSVNGFSCAGFQLRRQGLATRYLCLGQPDALGLPQTFIADTKDMRTMLSRFMNAVQRAKGKPAASFNPYTLAEGYPVRLWESPNGEVTWEAQLLSVASGPVPAELFRVPEASK